MQIPPDILTCNSECLTGRCPHKKCIKYLAEFSSKNSGSDISVFEPRDSYNFIKSDRNGYGIAIDVGTTTVVASLNNLDEGHEICRAAAINRQAAYGVDIIARVRYCQMHNEGLDILCNVIRSQLSDMIAALLKARGIEGNKVTYVTVCANTVISHILTGLSPVSLGTYPFEPVSLFGYELRCREIGIDLDAHCYIAPCISAFVGGDIVCGIIAVDFLRLNKAALMDIGTNGEAAVIAEGKISVTAAAAGPAFEGAGITCGMAAAPGAVSHVKWAQGKLDIETLGDERPRGITGSGLIDAVAAFLIEGSIDKSGRINADSQYACNEGGELRLNLTDDVYLTQRDIREFQTAKAALAAALLSLCNLSGMRADELQTIFLAGGFGNFMRVESATAVGLAPAAVKTISTGNSALKGAATLLMNVAAHEQAVYISKNSEPYNLAENQFFMGAYIDCMRLSRLL